ncbi:18925_t:CDS:2, partial [Acaulospora morrowiae]
DEQAKDQSPHTPPYQIFSSDAFVQQQSSNEGSNGQEFSDSDSTYSNFDYEKDNLRTIEQIQNYEVDNEDAYIKSIQLSQEARDASDPVNKLPKSDKRLLKKFWNSVLYFAYKLNISCNFTYSSSSETKTIRKDKWDKDLQPLLKKYQAHFEGKTVFNTILLDSAIEDVLAKPYTGTFIHKEHFDLIWIQDIHKRFLFIFQEPINSLCGSEQTELSYREDFVNPIIAKVFDDVKDLIRVKTGEVENTLSKNQRNETRQYKQRVQIGCYQDGIYKININATVFEISFLEIVGSAIYIDVTKLKEDTEKSHME